MVFWFVIMSLPLAWYGTGVLVWPSSVPITYLALPGLGLVGIVIGILGLCMVRPSGDARGVPTMAVGNILAGVVHLYLFWQILTRPVY